MSCPGPPGHPPTQHPLNTCDSEPFMRLGPCAALGFLRRDPWTWQFLPTQVLVIPGAAPLLLEKIVLEAKNSRPRVRMKKSNWIYYAW